MSALQRPAASSDVVQLGAPSIEWCAQPNTTAAAGQPSHELVPYIGPASAQHQHLHQFAAVGQDEQQQQQVLSTSLQQQRRACQPNPVSAAVVRGAVAALPVCPTAVSDLEGPTIELTKLDDAHVNVRVVHSFTAHFDRKAMATDSGAAAAWGGVRVATGSVGGHEWVEGNTNNAGSLLVEKGGQDGSSSGVSADAHMLVSEATVAAASVPLAAAAPAQLPNALSGWELDPRKLMLGQRIAVGGFAEVFLATYEGTTVAAKRLIAEAGLPAEDFMEEIRLLASLRHPNLLLFMGYTAHPLCMVSEYMARGSLFQLIRQRGASGVAVEGGLVRSVAASVARGMAYLHSRSPPVLHRDLKSPNILLDERWRIKICDFGLSKLRHHTYASCSHGVGTPEWMAPEVLRWGQFDERADVYSYGVVLWELLTGRPPWQELMPMQVVGAVGYGGMRLPAPPADSGDAFLRQLCSACLEVDPQLRPTFPAIVQMIDGQYGPQYAAAVHSDKAAVAAPAPIAAGIIVAPDRNNGVAAQGDVVSAFQAAALAADGVATPAICVAALPPQLDVASGAVLCDASTAKVSPVTPQSRLLGSSGWAMDLTALGGTAGQLGRSQPEVHPASARPTSPVSAPCAGGRQEASDDMRQLVPRCLSSPSADWARVGLAGRRRYRSPLAAELEPPAVAAKLWDGRKTASPRVKSVGSGPPSGRHSLDVVSWVDAHGCSEGGGGRPVPAYRQADVGASSVGGMLTATLSGRAERSYSSGLMGRVAVRASMAGAAVPFRRSRSQEFERAGHSDGSEAMDVCRPTVATSPTRVPDQAMDVVDDAAALPAPPNSPMRKSPSRSASDERLIAPKAGATAGMRPPLPPRPAALSYTAGYPTAIAAASAFHPPSSTHPHYHHHHHPHRRVHLEDLCLGYRKRASLSSRAPASSAASSSHGPALLPVGHTVMDTAAGLRRFQSNSDMLALHGGRQYSSLESGIGTGVTTEQRDPEQRPVSGPRPRYSASQLASQLSSRSASPFAHMSDSLFDAMDAATVPPGVHPSGQPAAKYMSPRPSASLACEVHALQASLSPQGSADRAFEYACTAAAHTCTATYCLDDNAACAESMPSSPLARSSVLPVTREEGMGPVRRSSSCDSAAAGPGSSTCDWCGGPASDDDGCGSMAVTPSSASGHGGCLTLPDAPSEQFQPQRSADHQCTSQCAVPDDDACGHGFVSDVCVLAQLPTHHATTDTAERTARVQGRQSITAFEDPHVQGLALADFAACMPQPASPQRAVSATADVVDDGDFVDSEEDLPCFRSFKMYRKGRFFVSALLTQPSTPLKSPGGRPAVDALRQYSVDDDDEPCLVGSTSMPQLPMFAVFGAASTSQLPRLELGDGANPKYAPARSLRTVQSSAALMSGGSHLDGVCSMQVVRVALPSRSSSRVGRHSQGGGHNDRSAVQDEGCFVSGGTSGDHQALELRHYHKGRFGVTESVLLSFTTSAEQLGNDVVGSSDAGVGGCNEHSPMFLSGPLPSWARDAALPHRRGMASCDGSGSLTSGELSEQYESVPPQSGGTDAHVADAAGDAVGDVGGDRDVAQLTRKVGRFSVHQQDSRPPIPRVPSMHRLPPSPSHRSTNACTLAVARPPELQCGSSSRSDSPPRCVMCCRAGLECCGGMLSVGGTSRRSASSESMACDGSGRMLSPVAPSRRASMGGGGTEVTLSALEAMAAALAKKAADAQAEMAEAEVAAQLLAEASGLGGMAGLLDPLYEMSDDEDMPSSWSTRGADVACSTACCYTEAGCHEYAQAVVPVASTLSPFVLVDHDVAGTVASPLPVIIVASHNSSVVGDLAVPCMVATSLFDASAPAAMVAAIEAVEAPVGDLAMPSSVVPPLRDAAAAAEMTAAPVGDACSCAAQHSSTTAGSPVEPTLVPACAVACQGPVACEAVARSCLVKFKKSGRFSVYEESHVAAPSPRGVAPGDEAVSSLA